MQETLMILSECDEINSLLYKPIVATQRIKYTCLNVSANYIVLGSTSGSLYLFIRESCIFQQLIPLSEGPVSGVAISPDEKTIALATKRGTVCLVALKPTPKLLAVSSEHLGEFVTSICWNDNSSEIYIGDGIGKISTMVLSIFTVNGMFQPISCALMHLDSTIVQMEFSGHLLLVSTMTRCYVCDTAQEQFKQIGNKARDGEFGACFLEKFVERDKSPSRAIGGDERVSGRKGAFNLISETNGDSRDDDSLKIYCARPGCRLWEVTANGIVVKTHQFKDALAVAPSSIYRATSSKQPTNRHAEQAWTARTTNFSHLYVLCRKYLFSHTSTGLYIIDTTNAAVILWNNEYTNVTMARTIDDRIYMMTQAGTFHCLTLSAIESLILDLYEKKRYNDCLRACNSLRPELARSIGIKRHERENEQSNEITSSLVPLISLIQSNANSQPIKLHSGIVVVNAGNGKFRNDEIRRFADEIKNRSLANPEIDDFSKNREDDGTTNNDVDPVITENLVIKRERSQEESGDVEKDICIDTMSRMSLNDDSTNITERATKDQENRDCSREFEDATSSIQKDLSPVYVMINSLKPTMTDIEIEATICKIRETISQINAHYGKIVKLKDFLYEVTRSTERHYYNVFLESTTTESLKRTVNKTIIDEATRAFVDINMSIVDECKCGYSWPDNENSQPPKFHDIGRTLVERFADERIDDLTKLCNSVPHMWRYYLSAFSQRCCALPDDILSMCLRTSDNVVLSIVLPSIDARQWEIANKCLTIREENLCPRCERRRDGGNSRKNTRIEWSGVAREIMKRDGAKAAMNFLALVESVIPNITLDRSIFQSIIFTKILEHHGIRHTVEFDSKRTGSNEYEAMCSPKIQEQLADALEKDLERPIDKNIFGIGPHHWGMRFQAKSSTCPCCTLSLHTPVLLGHNGISVFPCGHAYHVNCLIQRKLTRCDLH